MSLIVGPGRTGPGKSTTYESGMNPVGDARRGPLGARGAIRAADLTPWTRRNFARWMFEDYPRALVLTPDRWRRDMFAARGAYARS